MHIVFVSVLQRNGNNRIHIYTYMTFTIGINSSNQRDQEVPWVVVCNLEDRESRSHNSVRVRRSRNQEHQCPGAGKDGCPRSESKVKLPPPFCPLPALSRLNGAHPHWWGRASFLSLSMQMLISFWNIFTDITSYVGISWPSQVDT